LRSERDGLRDELDARDGALRERDEQIARLQSDAVEREQALRRLAGRRAAQAARLAARLRAVREPAEDGEETASLRAEVERLAGDVRGCDAEIERLRHESIRRRAQAARFLDRLLEQRRRPPDQGEADALRAEVERLSDDVRGCDAEIDRLRRETVRLRARSSRFAERLLRDRRAAQMPGAPPSTPANGHVLFVQLADGYRLLEREGSPPSQSDVVELPELVEGPLVVTGSRRSPLPGDARPCVVAQLP
jgi:chromosome segregation ATPase